jgi:predicted CoA-binding protein
MDINKMECQIKIPSINSNKEEIKDIFKNTTTIAIIGLSPKEEKASNMVGKYLQKNNFKIYPIYPKGEYILGEKAYKNLDEINNTINIDMVIIFRKSEAVLGVVNSILKRNDIKFLWNQIGVVNDEAVKKVIEKNIKVIQNKCAMIEHKALLQ